MLDELLYDGYKVTHFFPIMFRYVVFFEEVGKSEVGFALLMAKMVDSRRFYEEFLGDVMRIHYLCSNL
jgi:hypothetical protein